MAKITPHLSAHNCYRALSKCYITQHLGVFRPVSLEDPNFRGVAWEEKSLFFGWFSLLFTEEARKGRPGLGVSGSYFWARSSYNFLGQKSRRTVIPRIFFRIFVPDFAPNFSLSFPRIFWGVFVLRSWETEARKNSPKIHAIFQCNIPWQIRKKYSQHVSGEEAKW